MRTTVRQMAEWVTGELVGDGDVLIDAARPLTEAGPGDITFVEGEKNLSAWHASQASAAVVPLSVPLNSRPLIRVADPLAAFTAIVLHLRGLRTTDPTGRIDPTAHVHPSARIGPDSSIGPFAVIGEGVILGARCQIHAGAFVGRNCQLGDEVMLYPHAVIYDDCKLGHRVAIHANAVIGADGFGYRTQSGRHVKVPQLGWVELGDDVEVGACTTIDRGTFGPTRIGAGTKIDNLVMIGHNCQIGRHNLLVSQVGIAGSSTTGDYVIMAGQSGMADHLSIGDRAVITARAGVVKDVPADARMAGIPARPQKEAMRSILSAERVPELIRDVRRIKQALGLGDEE